MEHPLVSEPPPAERRQLTVMFCDLVGSTRLLEILGAEAFRDLVSAFQRSCQEVVEFFDGHIAQYLGDGLLVYFGYPSAHEDDARRAVRAGLGILEATARLNARPAVDRSPCLAVRVGIHSSQVVVGEMGAGARREQLALGEAPNVAARLQERAQPDTVLVSAATYRLIEGFFHCEALGEAALKGFSRPVAVYRVLRDSGTETRFDVAAAQGLTPLVDRASELMSLLACWDQATKGSGRVVLLSGDPGIGKTRLVHALRESLADQPHRRLECRCSPYHATSAFYPVIDLLARVLGFTSGDLPQEKLRKLKSTLALYDLCTPDTVPLFTSLLAVPDDDAYAPGTVTPERRRQRTMEAIVSALLKLAAQQPTLLVAEDLHWADPSTLELFSLLVERAATSRILVIYSFRPSYTAPWAPSAHLTALTLERLTPPEVGLMINRLVGGKLLPDSLFEQLVTKSDGVPLFVEESARMLLESDFLVEADDRFELVRPLPSLAIPATLHDSLMARLDATGPAKSIAQLGAVLGRQFSYEFIHAVAAVDETELQVPLRRLVHAGLLYQQGQPPRATYTFKHALIQDAAQGSLLKSTRQQYHRKIAKTLEQRFPEIAETQPEVLAYHWTEAALPDPAIDCWHRAGQRAVERSANVEAISHFTKALDLINSTQDSGERRRRELAIQINLGIAFVMTKGYAAPEVGRTYDRAQVLCQQLGETPQLFPALWGLWVFYFVRSSLHAALDTAEQLLRLGQVADDSGLLVEAHQAMGLTLYHRGDLVRARAHLEQGIDRYHAEQHRLHRFVYGQDPGVTCRVYLAHTLWLLGYVDGALTRNTQALVLAGELSHPYSLALARSLAAILYDYRREVAAALAQAEVTIALSAEHGFPFFGAMGTILRGAARAQQGHDEGIDQIRQGLAAYQALGTELTLPHRLALLAEACAARGRIEEGLLAVAEGIERAERSGDRYYLAELYRLKGELALKQSSSRQDEAEACFRNAHDIARSQHAKSLELRAAMSLARVWQRRKERAAAIRILTETIGWFTEGLDGTELQQATALVREIEAGRE